MMEMETGGKMKVWPSRPGRGILPITRPPSYIFTINNHRFLCVCGDVPHPSAPLTGPIFMIFSHLDREFTGDDARLFHFSFGALWSPVLR